MSEFRATQLLQQSKTQRYKAVALLLLGQHEDAAFWLRTAASQEEQALKAMDKANRIAEGRH